MNINEEDDGWRLYVKKGSLNIGYASLLLAPIFIGVLINGLNLDSYFYWWAAYNIILAFLPIFILMHLIFPTNERRVSVDSIFYEMRYMSNQTLTAKEIQSHIFQVNQIINSRKPINYLFPLVLLVVIEVVGFFVVFSRFHPLISNAELDEFIFSVPNTVLYGFCGGWVYAIYSILSRYSRADISPGLVFTLAFQIFFSGIAAYFIIELLEVSQGTASAIAFSFGFIPYADSAEWIQVKANSYLVTDKQDSFNGDRKIAAERDNLTYIPGLSKIDIRRLNEEGIYSVQQLALVDPISLYFVTSYSLYNIVMWISEAYLRTFVSNETALKLASVGIRGAVSLNIKEIQLIESNTVSEPSWDKVYEKLAELMSNDIDLVKVLLKKAEYDRKIVFLKALMEIENARKITGPY